MYQQYNQSPYLNQPIQQGQPYGAPPMQMQPMMVQQQYAPAQGIMVQPMMQPTTVIIEQGGSSSQTSAYGCEFPVSITCPGCKHNIQTRVTKTVGSDTIVAAFLCGCLVCPLMAFYPCINDHCQDSIHYCPQCGTQVGEWKYVLCR